MSRGRLRIYLGAAPGVGKTFAMLDEGSRRRSRGTDVVVGFVETHGRPQTAARLGGLEVIPRQQVRYRGAVLEEMDVDAVLARAPKVALVDELAHTNAPGSRNPKRWQDVRELLNAGIDVISTLNVQHLESLNDVVEQITGIHQQETVPDEVVRAADQVQLVDMTAEALRRRMVHGNIYRPDKVDAALGNYFRPGNLEALRELALLWVADRVDEGLAEYREAHGIQATWETRERVVVALTGAASAEHLIRRAARMAQRGHGDLLGVHVRSTDGRHQAPAARLEEHRQLLESMGGVYHEVVADDVVGGLIDFARRENATQIVLGSSGRSRWAELTRGSVINAVTRASGTIDVHIISPHEVEEPADGLLVRPGHRPARTRHGLSPRRRLAGFGTALAGNGLVTLGLTNTRDQFDQGSRFLIYQLVVLVAAAIGGAAPALIAALTAAAALNWFFIHPVHTLTISDAENVIALVIFGVVGAAVGLLVTRFAQHSARAKRASLEAEALARVAGGMVGADDPLPSISDRIRSTLALDGVALYAGGADGEVGELLVSSGTMPDPAHDTRIPVNGATLVIKGVLEAENRRMLEVFALQLASALERRQLQREAAAAARLAATDALRTSILRAVSHDLRTPLASIKASVSSLRQDDIDWDDADRKEFLSTIEEESDRLNRVIGDLLDASRLDAGIVEPRLAAVALDDVIPPALDSVSRLDIPVEVHGELPVVVADAGLLERVVANLVANAAAHSPNGGKVEIGALVEGAWIELRVADHGEGIPEADQERVFEPFRRLGSNDGGARVGLGLSVARGFVEAMGGTIGIEDTIGGGCTMVVRLPSYTDGKPPTT